MSTESSATIEKESEFLLTSPPTANAMSVTKRNGTTELVDLNKIVRAVQRSSEGLHAVDPMRVAAPFPACTTAPPPASWTSCPSEPPPC